MQHLDEMAVVLPPTNNILMLPCPPGVDYNPGQSCSRNTDFNMICHSTPRDITLIKWGYSNDYEVMCSTGTMGL